MGYHDRGEVLLTGATGFVGAAVLDVLVAGGHAVVALVRTEAAAEVVRAAGGRAVLGDLLASTPALVEAIAGAHRVVHCAQPRGPGERARADVTLLRAVDPRRAARVVFVCGSSYFGVAAGGETLDETAPPRPFGLGPTFVEGLGILRAREREGLDQVAAYVGGVYGARSWFVRAYLRAIAAGEPIPVLDPPPRWPYVHIDDCARAIAHLATAESAALTAVGRDVIIADDGPTRMDVFIEEVARAAGREASLLRLDEASLRARVPPGQASYLTADMPHSNGRLRRLGFTCRYPTVREGLRALGPRLREGTA